MREGQAGFCVGRSSVDNVYVSNEVGQGRLEEDKVTYADVKKAYDTLQRDGLGLKLWEMGVRGKLWKIIKQMYEFSKSAVLLEGEKSDRFKAMW